MSDKIIDILRGDPNKPFSINLQINTKNNDVKELFEKIRDIYLKGLSIQTNNENTNKINYWFQ